MANRQLGMLALIGAPSMFIGINIEHNYSQMQDTWFTGAWGIVYITAWMCSLVVLQRRKVAANGFGKWLIRVMFITLTIANISNVVQILSPKNDPWYFFYIDLFWPISHLLMLVLGITVQFNKQLQRPVKLILLAAGLWLPVALVPMAIFGKTDAVVFYPAVYNAVMWGLMAFIAIKQQNNHVVAVA